ncbi:MAG: hypothetical protein M3007_01895 [Candidatus Eremiobacteraeota bacterium]|nr:hypothetical protein [Candidatus Eremiobacteraeota bacterium]
MPQTSGAGVIALATSTPTQHILTMAPMMGYQGSTCCTLAQASPYVSWLFNLPGTEISTAHANGMHVTEYYNAEVARPCCTPWWSLLQANPQYIARDCSGHIISPDSNPSISEMPDITRAGWRSLWVGIIRNNGLDAVYADGAGDPGSGMLPCGATDSSYVSDLAAMFSSVVVPVIANNVFESGTTGTNWHTVDASANVMGALADSDCYVDGPGSHGRSTDYAIVQSMHSYGYSTDDWGQRENDELYLAAQGKQFWCLVGATGTASSETALRIYAYASLMLTYSLTSTGYWTYWKTATPGQVEVYPETGLVPTNPVAGTPSSIISLRAGNVYAREYKDCFYRGKDKGPCTFVVNPTTSTQNWPALSRAYAHTMTLSGGGVLEGGIASFTGPAPPATLASGSAVIALR